MVLFNYFQTLSLPEITIAGVRPSDMDPSALLSSPVTVAVATATTGYAFYK